MAAEKLRQSFIAGPDKRVVTIVARLHKGSGQYVVLWRDIKSAFPGLRNIVIMQGCDIVSPATDSESLERLEPECIEYSPDTALEITGDVISAGEEATFSPSTADRMTFQDTYMHLSSSRSRAESAASSLSAVDSMISSQYTSAQALGGPSFFVSPPDTPIHSENHVVHIGMNLDYQSLGSNRAKLVRHARSSSHSGHYRHQKDVQYGLATTDTGKLRRSASTAERRDASRMPTVSNSGSRLYSSRENDIRGSLESLDLIQSFPPCHRRVPSQDQIDISSSDFDDERHYSTLESFTHPTAFGIPVARSDRPDSIIQTHEYLQDIESRVQSFEKLITHGRIAQALVVQQEAESIKQEMAQYHSNLQSEIAKNSDLQAQIHKMMGEADGMLRQIVHLQEEQAVNSKKMMEDLAKILSMSTAILNQTYELHEFPIPRLFIILPKGDIITTREKIETTFVDRLRLYFLCECGKHTQSVNGAPSALSHDIHLARHEGYDLDRRNEFFRKYGSYVLALLQMFRYGATAAGMVVAGLDSAKVVEGLDHVLAGLKMVKKDLIPEIDSTIKYLKDLTKTQERVSHNAGNGDSTATMANSTSIGKLEGLEGADLRGLASFLRGSDDGMALGNLYRTVTPEGHVKWVCLDHYRESYGVAAVQEFKKRVKDVGATYDEEARRVTVRLGSTDQAKLFYALLPSIRHIHKLELELDWNAGVEDLRGVKLAVMQSGISHLLLDLRDNTSPILDVLTHRSEPIINIMAHPTIHTLTLRNITSFLSPTKDSFKTATLHLREFDLDEQIVLEDDFGRLENMIRGSPVLVRLAIVVGDIVATFDRLRPLVVEHKTLSALEIRLKNGTAASVLFEKGSDKITGVNLKVVEHFSPKLRKLPMVTSVELLDKNPLLHSSQHTSRFIKNCRNLKKVVIAQLPDGGADVFLALQRAIDIYSGRVENVEGALGKEVIASEADTVQTSPDKVEVGFLELELAHRRSMLWNMVLLVASDDGSGTAMRAAAEIQGTSPATFSDACVSLAFTCSRMDGSLASVRFELGQGASNSVVLHIDDFNPLGFFGDLQASKLTVVGGGRLDRLKALTEDAASVFNNLKVLVLEYNLEHFLDILQHLQQAKSHFPALRQLLFWNTSEKVVTEFRLPLQHLSLFDHTLSTKHLPSLYNLVRTASTLSRVSLSISSLLETYECISSAAQVNKQLSHVQLMAGASRMSIQFVIGSGDVQSIALHISESDLDPLFSLPMVTELSIWSTLTRSALKVVATSILSQFQHIALLKISFSDVHTLEVIDELGQAACVCLSSRACRVILTDLSTNSSHLKKTELNLPLKALDITSYNLGDDDLDIMEGVFRTNAGIQELYVSVKSVDIAHWIFNYLLREHRPMTTLSVRLQKRAPAVFSLERGKSKEKLVITQKVLDGTLCGSFFLPDLAVDRVDVIGAGVDKSRAAEIAIFVMRHCCEVTIFRFPDLPGQVKDIATLIKDLVDRDVPSPEIDGAGEIQVSRQSNRDVGGLSDVPVAGLAFYEAFGAELSADSSSSVNDGGLASWILRARPTGLFEEVRLECSNIDKVTLRLITSPFDKSDIAHLSSMTELQISIGYGATLINTLVQNPVKIFSALTRLELSCGFSQHLSALLVALTAASYHSVLKEVKIWHPDRSSVGITYSLPVEKLDLTMFSISTTKDHIVKEILLASTSLLELSLKVSDLISAFKSACTGVWTNGSLVHLHLHDNDDNTVSVQFKPGTGGVDSISVSFTKVSDPGLQWDLQMLKILFSSEQLLKIIEAVQYVTIDNADIQRLHLMNKDNGTAITIGVPFKEINFTAQPLSGDHLKALQPLLLSCPFLWKLHLTVSSGFNLRQAIKRIQPVFVKFKALTDIRLMLRDGTVASIRFKEENGTVVSVALRVPEKMSNELTAIPNVKKITICPKDSTRWHKVKDWSMIGKVFQVFPELETLELDAAVISPLSGLLYLQHQAQTHPPRPFRRFRQRMLRSSKELTTHDFPLQTLHLEVESADILTMDELMALFLVSPLLSEVNIMLPTSSEIDTVYGMLIPTTVECGRLQSWTIKSHDGFAMSVRLQGATQVGAPDDHTSRDIEIVEVQVSGFKWPLCFYGPQTTRLIVLPGSDGATTDGDGRNSKNQICDMLSVVSQKLPRLSHLTLTCPIKTFFEYLKSVVKIQTITQFDLQDPISYNTTLSSTLGPSPVAIAYLSEIPSQDFLSTFRSISSNYHLNLEIGQRGGELPEFNIIMDRQAKDVSSIFKRIVLDARKVSCRRILELLYSVSGTRTADDGLEFQLKWWIECTSKTRPEDGRGGEGQAPADGILGNKENMAALVKLLAWRVTEFDINYEAMMALLPLVKAEVERDCFGRLEPFSRLRHYKVDCVEESLRSDFVQFQLLIPKPV